MWRDVTRERKNRSCEGAACDGAHDVEVAGVCRRGGKCLHVGDERERGGASRWADAADLRASDLCHGDGQQEVRDAALYGYAGLLGFVLQVLGY